MVRKKPIVLDPNAAPAHEPSQGQAIPPSEPSGDDTPLSQITTDDIQGMEQQNLDDAIEKAKEELEQQTGKFEDAEVQKSYNTFYKTLSNINNKAMGVDVIEYVIRQLNPDSLQGNLNHFQFRIAFRSAVKGLGRLCYLKYWGADSVEQDAMMFSAINFIHMQFTRVYMGRYAAMKEKEIMAKQPLVIQ